jgi:solute:Na+ symporter, SSS family
MAIKFFIPLYRSVGSPSAYTYLEERFGPWAKNYVAIFWLLNPGDAGGSDPLSSRPADVCDSGMGHANDYHVITGISVMIYAILGGIRAVIWTDAIQAIILITGAVVTLGILMFSLPEGPGQYFEIAASS